MKGLTKSPAASIDQFALRKAARLNLPHKIRVFQGLPKTFNSTCGASGARSLFIEMLIDWACKLGVGVGMGLGIGVS